MAKPVIFVDEFELSKLIQKLDNISSKLDELRIKENSGLKEKWYVTDDVCRLLNVSKRKLQDIRDKGEIKFKKTGKKIYYKASDVELYLEK
jgi:excisionase family DNA binding protein